MTIAITGNAAAEIQAAKAESNLIPAAIPTTAPTVLPNELEKSKRRFIWHHGNNIPDRTR